MKVKNTIKYALTDKTKTIQGHTLHQIVALRDIKPLSVYKGMRGGYIEKEANLSHSGNCWVDDDAQVFENARINGDAYVKDNAQIYGSAVLDGNVRVRGMSAVYEHARLTDHAEVCDRARIYGHAYLQSYTSARGDCKIYGNAKMYGKTVVRSNAVICGDASLYDNAVIGKDGFVDGLHCGEDSNSGKECYYHMDYIGTSYDVYARDVTAYTTKDGVIMIYAGPFDECTMDEYRGRVCNDVNPIILHDCLVKLDHAQNYLRDVAYEVGLSSSLEQMEQEKPAAQL